MVVCLGGYKLLAWSFKPGKVAEFHVKWPLTSKLKVQAQQASFILFLHPNCACSYSTLEELERLMPALQKQALVQVVFMRPVEESFSWDDSKVWRRAQDIPFIQIIQDRDGFEAATFGAKTSGQAFLYDPSGDLIFEGGLTPSRGHTGDSLGQRAIISFFEKRKLASVTHTDVYGCNLLKRGLNVVDAQ